MKADYLNSFFSLGPDVGRIIFDYSEVTEKYDLCLMSDDTKPEKGKLYIKNIGNSLQYTVIDPNGGLITGNITQEEFEHDIPEPFDINKIKPFFPSILKITSERCHTHGDDKHAHDTYKNNRFSFFRNECHDFYHHLAIKNREKFKEFEIKGKEFLKEIKPKNVDILNFFNFGSNKNKYILLGLLLNHDSNNNKAFESLISQLKLLLESNKLVTLSTLEGLELMYQSKLDSKKSLQAQRYPSFIQIQKEALPFLRSICTIHGLTILQGTGSQSFLTFNQMLALYKKNSEIITSLCTKFGVAALQNKIVDYDFLYNLPDSMIIIRAILSENGFTALQAKEMTLKKIREYTGDCFKLEADLNNIVKFK